MDGPPSVTSVSPNSGPVDGGTGVTIRGSNFVDGATVTFGGIPATDVYVWDDNTGIFCDTPPHSSGLVDVAVTNPFGGSSTLSSGYTYVDGPPSVTSFSPNSGPVDGGTGVTIRGANFVDGATVTFGGIPATDVYVWDDNTGIFCDTPPHSSGLVDVAVTNPSGGSSTLSSGYTYVDGPPSVTSVSPNSGPVDGGTGVTIRGSNFVDGATVTFGGIPATDVYVWDDNTGIFCDTPAHSAGTVDISVTNPSGKGGTLSNGYSYIGGITIYVSNVEDCDGNSPCENSIQAAIEQCTNGAIIDVSGGSYDEDVTLYVLKMINFQGSNSIVMVNGFLGISKGTMVMSKGSFVFTK